ncbi:FAD:protein FMN transferase, partial [Microbacteriaceae bacterium K1510]|nr:FAD:protein FMN transferase [Microbacteriaceae bacterium K1510]
MMHHLIDPRTMRPCNSDVMQCTVTGPSAVECEIWAKVVCILGSSAAIPLLLRNIPHCDALFISKVGDVHFVGDLRRFN